MKPHLLPGIALLMMALFLHTDAHAGLKNALANHASPYLAMHAGDPVYWQEWNEQTVAMARRQNKLLFVSVGYFACHWCHVMQRESYQNPAIAAKLNSYFIPVKVDRELNPALDTRLIEFVERTRGYSGWPLNVFITPEGHPLLGIVYLPPKDFGSLVDELQTLWQQDHVQLSADAKVASEEFVTAALPEAIPLKTDLAGQVRTQLKKVSFAKADHMAGGFGNQGKFPSVPQLAALLESYASDSDAQTAEFLRLTLDNMAKLGLHDIVGGGFFRYTVDPQWHVPHFEKMLYDNALLASLYLRAGTLLDEPAYLAIARQTLDFMQSELAGRQGGLYASLSAIDSNDIEGGYYLWQAEELQALLTTDEWLAVSKAWKIEGSMTTDDGYLPLAYRDNEEVAAELAIPLAELRQRLVSAKQKMLAARKHRSLPVDDKQLAAWNGLALSAFAEGAAVFDDKRYRDMADRIRTFILDQLWQEGRLLRARDTNGKALGEATLEDYAYVAQGLLAWARLSKQTKDYDEVGRIIRPAWERFFTAQGWRLTETSLLATATSQVMLADGPMPSPSAELLRATLGWLQEREDSELRAQAMHAISAGQALLLDDPYWFASQAWVVFMLQQP